MTSNGVEHLNLAVTYACNSRCIHCNIWQNRPRHELKLGEIRRRIVASPLLCELRSVGITGGEPFLRKDLEEICASFWQAHPELAIGIATHGMQGLRIAERALHIRGLAGRSRFGVSISIDGMGPDHDRQRGIEGAFEQSMRTVEVLAAEDVDLVLSLTITPTNYRSLFEVYDLARSLGVGFITRFGQNSFYYGNETTCFHWDEESLEAAQRQLDRVIAEILATIDLSSPQLDPYVYFLTRAGEYQRHQTRLTPCLSGTCSLYVDSFGKVFPCIMLDKEVGSLRDRALDEIYQGPELVWARQRIAARKCHCWTECETVHTLEKMHHLLEWDPRKLLPNYGLVVTDRDGVLHAEPAQRAQGEAV